MRSPEIGRQEACYHVRFGSETDICAAKGHVRFTPESDIQRVTIGCPLRGQKRTLTDLFDHLVGASDEWLRNCEVECLGKLEVDGQLDLRHLLNRQVANLFAFENATRYKSRFVEFLRPVCPVGHETSREEILAVRIYRRQPVTGRQPDDAITLRQKERFPADHKRADAFADEGRKGGLDLIGSACGLNDKAPAEGTCLSIQRTRPKRVVTERIDCG